VSPPNRGFDGVRPQAVQGPWSAEDVSLLNLLCLLRDAGDAALADEGQNPVRGVVLRRDRHRNRHDAIRLGVFPPPGS